MPPKTSLFQILFWQPSSHILTDGLILQALNTFHPLALLSKLPQHQLPHDAAGYSLLKCRQPVLRGAVHQQRDAEKSQLPERCQ